MPDWRDIAHVFSVSEAELQCPICLEMPLAAQTTTCGHVFCFPCLLKYAAVNSEGNRTPERVTVACPLCFAQVALTDLRSLGHSVIKPVQLNRLSEFKRLSRDKDSAFPCVRRGSPFPVSKHGRCSPFSKLTLTCDHGAALDSEIDRSILSRAEDMAREGGASARGT